MKIKKFIDIIKESVSDEKIEIKKIKSKYGNWNYYGFKAYLTIELAIDTVFTDYEVGNIITKEEAKKIVDEYIKIMIENGDTLDLLRDITNNGPNKPIENISLSDNLKDTAIALQMKNHSFDNPGANLLI